MEERIEELKKMTPMMEQWHACKRRAKEAVLLFRMGDFYEAFYEDAKILADAVEVTLTKRQGIPMSGIPWHVADTYFEKLVSKGYKIAVAEQVEDPKKAKGLVQREIVRFITPGTLVNSAFIQEKNHNFIASIGRVGAIFGIASLDLSTGIFQVLEVEDESELANELYRLSPSEIVISKKFMDKHPLLFKEKERFYITLLEDWRFDHQFATLFLTKHFQVQNLDGYGLKGMVAAINAAGALLSYISEDLVLPIHHIREIRPCFTEHVLNIDAACAKNLELIESLNEGSKKNTLLTILDLTQTAMGGRLIREWIKKPLFSETEIQKRLNAVETFSKAQEFRFHLKEELHEIRDLERIMMKVSTGLANPRDLIALKHSLARVKPIKDLLHLFEEEAIASASLQLKDVSDVMALIENAIVEDPPARVTDGNIFREGFSQELDDLLKLTRGGKEWLSAYQTRLKEELGIKTLKVSFNKVFGYYIEVSKGQASQMPHSFQRMQTLVNSERFISSELKEYEHKVLTAEERMQTLEEAYFRQLCGQIALSEKKILEVAKALGIIDVLFSLAQVAKKNGYSRPFVDMSKSLIIKGGRHPVIEEVIGKEQFIPNNCDLSENKTLMLITGPNMAGKSTYIRQIALIVIMAQIGSFVPAQFCHIGLIDRIFSRIGASDDLSRGQSTFMVEMTETANILHNVTENSLVILDEIGRGTSTYDGVSIAFAVSEYLIQKKAKTLFATHYWELTELESAFSSVVNAHAAVSESAEGIVFLHKIAKGGTDKSYGIHVAKLAGLPFSVIKRAMAILNKLESRQESPKLIKKEKESAQLTFF